MTIGLDANILCYALDPAFPENLKCRRILADASAQNRLGINPTVLHETYHTLVFYQKWVPSETRQRLLTVLQHPYLDFYNQTRRISQIALDLAPRYKLGGRDALIIANFSSQPSFAPIHKRRGTIASAKGQVAKIRDLDRQPPGLNSSTPFDPKRR